MKKLFLALTSMGVVFSACNNAADKTSKTETKSSDTAVTTVDHSTMDMDTAAIAPAGGGIMQSMKGMMGSMASMQMSGDFDVDYANAMIAHHQGALDMAQMEVAQGKDEKMKAMAQSILNKQNQEQNNLKAFTQSYKPSGMKHGEGELKKSVDATSSKMMAAPMTGDIDKDFAAMMISHHEHGVAMDKLLVEHGMDNNLKAMAKKSIASQQKEIKEFKSWMSANQ